MKPLTPSEVKARRRLANAIDAGEIKVQVSSRAQAQAILALIVEGKTFGEAWVATL